MEGVPVVEAEVEEVEVLLMKRTEEVEVVVPWRQEQGEEGLESGLGSGEEVVAFPFPNLVWRAEEEEVQRRELWREVGAVLLYLL